VQKESAATTPDMHGRHRPSSIGRPTSTTFIDRAVSGLHRERAGTSGPIVSKRHARQRPWSGRTRATARTERRPPGPALAHSIARASSPPVPLLKPYKFAVQPVSDRHPQTEKVAQHMYTKTGLAAPWATSQGVPVVEGEGDKMMEKEGEEEGEKKIEGRGEEVGTREGEKVGAREGEGEGEGSRPQV
jgi:hypothetical protein